MTERAAEGRFVSLARLYGASLALAPRLWAMQLRGRDMARWEAALADATRHYAHQVEAFRP